MPKPSISNFKPNKTIISEVDFTQQLSSLSAEGWRKGSFRGWLVTKINKDGQLNLTITTNIFKAIWAKITGLTNVVLCEAASISLLEKAKNKGWINKQDLPSVRALASRICKTSHQAIHSELDGLIAELENESPSQKKDKKVSWLDSFKAAHHDELLPFPSVVLKTASIWSATPLAPDTAKEGSTLSSPPNGVIKTEFSTVEPPTYSHLTEVSSTQTPQLVTNLFQKATEALPVSLEPREISPPSSLPKREQELREANPTEIRREPPKVSIVDTFAMLQPQGEPTARPPKKTIVSRANRSSVTPNIFKLAAGAFGVLAVLFSGRHLLSRSENILKPLSPRLFESDSSSLPEPFYASHVFSRWDGTQMVETIRLPEIPVNEQEAAISLKNTRETPQPKPITTPSPSKEESEAISKEEVKPLKESEAATKKMRAKNKAKDKQKQQVQKVKPQETVVEQPSLASMPEVQQSSGEESPVITIIEVQQKSGERPPVKSTEESSQKSHKKVPTQVKEQTELLGSRTSGSTKSGWFAGIVMAAGAIFSVCAWKERKPIPFRQQATSLSLQGHDSPSKLVSSKGILDSEENQPSFKIINWQNADPQIRSQVQAMWPRYTAKLTKGAPEGDRVVCITDGNKLVGCVALIQSNINQPLSLVKEIGSQKVYKLDIQINHDYHNKGYGRAVFNHACNSIIEEGALVYLVDQAAAGVGDRLYGGENTRALFDVCHILSGDRGIYLLKQKTQENNNSLRYLKIDPAHTYVFFKAVESLEGLNHLLRYLEDNPEDITLIDHSVVELCEEIPELYKKAWSKEKLLKYGECVDKLRALTKIPNPKPAKSEQNLSLSLSPPLQTIPSNAVITTTSHPPPHAAPVSPKADGTKEVAMYKPRSSRKKLFGYLADTPIIKKLLEEPFFPSGPFRDTLAKMMQDYKAWLIIENLTYPTIEQPNRAALEVQAAHYAEKYQEFGVQIEITHLNELNDTLSRIKKANPNTGVVGIAIGNDIKLEGHVLPLLCYFSQDIPEGVEFVSIDVLGISNLAFAEHVEEELNKSGFHNIVTYQGKARQADGHSCRTGALTLLCNAILDLKQKKFQGNLRKILNYYGVGKGSKGKWYLKGIPDEWSVHEQIFIKQKEDALHIRDLVSKNQNKRKKARTVKTTREQHQEKVTMKYTFGIGVGLVA